MDNIVEVSEERVAQIIANEFCFYGYVRNSKDEKWYSHRNNKG